ncbi:hypothetical protein M1M34_gp006 [Haloarcula tailed virus 2]|uniref:Uncharacterized protein n=1 Tax=Haloarcula tailed virus 2 TaxID=2877989 RepID=A0AAE8XZG7_9CAUD|nr:hypothetical protein M1M34_gp006 [Haloarcula tailed virus 2]UBF23157.1 hypothetical protein HATV-2_gp6 [Haloarcula tailed virus 2]
MTNLLTNIGEEWYTDTSVDGATIIVGVYDDGADTITESDLLSAIQSEPTGSLYGRESDTVTTAVVSGNFGLQNDSQITFDTSDSTETVNHGFIVVNFQSDKVNGDGSAQDHLIGVGPLNQSRDLSQIDELVVAAGEITVTID